jgi:hypothetical protein
MFPSSAQRKSGMAEIQVHEIEYLAASNATIGDPPNEHKVVVITVRPDQDSFRPHNLSVPQDQAARLLEDLKVVLSRSAVWSLLLLAVTGCSAEVETETTSPRLEATDQSTVTKERTRVAVDLLTDQGIGIENGRATETPLDGVLTVEGCLHFHQTLIIHLGDADRASERRAIEIIREWQDEPCERHRRK